MMKQSKGITLVALVLTIIVLLILAGISIQAITNTGIFTQANNAKRESEIANIKEQIALDIYEKQLAPPVGSITEDQLKTILEKHGTIIYEEDGVTIKGITTEKGYEILLKDIYGGETVAELVPDGAIVNPVNDITTWLKTGEISNQYSYTTIEQVIADTTCTESLMKNENAMKYLARSTEFADAICESEKAMTYLGQSEYIENTVLNSDVWKQKIKASQYWTLVYDSKTVDVYGAAAETITVEGYYGLTFSTNNSGYVSHVIPVDIITLTGSVSGQSFTRNITNETTEVKVMPDGEIWYWFGYINPKYGSPSFNYPFFSSGYTGNTTITKNINSINYQNERVAMVAFMSNKTFKKPTLKYIYIGTGDIGLSNVYGGLQVNPYNGQSSSRVTVSETDTVTLGNFSVSSKLYNDDGYIYFAFGADGVTSHNGTLYAFWVE